MKNNFLNAEVVQELCGARKVYIAGKITGDDNYRAKFDRVRAALEGEGYIPLSPAVLPDGMTAADYMRICFAMIDVADAVLFLPDWEASPGARLEMEYCGYIAKRVVELDDD